MPQITLSCLASPKLQADSAMNLVEPMRVTCLGEEIKPDCQKTLTARSMQHAVLSRNGRNLDEILGCREQSLSGRDFVLDSQEVGSQLLFLCS